MAIIATAKAIFCFIVHFQPQCKVYELSVSFLIWTTITLEGKIKTEKVWREALKEYAEKRTKYKLEEKDLKIESEDK